MASTEEDTITLALRIDAPPEVVFSYFTDAERYRMWQGSEAELDARPGGVFRVTMTGQSKTVASGIFLEVEPHSRVVFTWGWEQLEWLPEEMRFQPGMSTVEVTLTPDGDGTFLEMRHGGLPTSGACRFHSWGWGLSLDRLVSLLNGGEPLPDPFAEL